MIEKSSSLKPEHTHERAEAPPELPIEILKKLIIPARSWIGDSAKRQKAFAFLGQAKDLEKVPLVNFAKELGVPIGAVSKQSDLLGMSLRSSGGLERFIRVLRYLNWAEKNPKAARHVYLKLNAKNLSANEARELSERLVLEDLTKRQMQIAQALAAAKSEYGGAIGTKAIRRAAINLAIAIPTLEAELKKFGGPEALLAILARNKSAED